jgi:hypothetical protein
MRRKPIVLAMLAAIAGTSVALAAPAVVVDQELLDQVFELKSDFENKISKSVDANDVQKDPNGFNTDLGEQNLQENHALFAPNAESDLRQNLGNNSFDTNAETDLARVRNSVDLDVNHSDDLTADVGVNAASGAFNLQANSSVIAPLTGDSLAQSSAAAQQAGQLNSGVVQDTNNDVLSNIVLDNVSVNVGINSVSGTGNEQINTSTIRTNFGGP